MKTVAIIQARMGSSRLPGKVLEDLGGRQVIAWTVDAARAISGIDQVVVATSDQPADDALVHWCAGYGVTCYRGPEEDVLERFVIAARAEDADRVMRLTADCPLLDPQVCGLVVALMEKSGADYTCNFDPRSWPDGLDCEIFSMELLAETAAKVEAKFDREHVTPYMRANRYRFRIEQVMCPIPGIADQRWTLDTPNDLEFLRAVVSQLRVRGGFPAWLDILNLIDANPDLQRLGRAIGQGQVAPQVMASKRSYSTSKKLLARAEKIIPMGSQTFSKSSFQYPKQAPMFLAGGDGANVWDVDGNRFVDLVSGLLPVVLGYRDPDVDAAVRRQLCDGISFSLSSVLETDLAERLVEIIPCAEKVRFGKNGTDATSAAVRLARAFTGRDRIAVCGYHGWQDWYIGGTPRNKGVPDAVAGLTHTFPYNDMAVLESLFSEHDGQFAAVVMEPANVVEPEPGYLDAIKNLAHAHGALLVFDEIITGFRFDLGGAQTLFGVTPDLACFGKAMGNGMPISAVLGRADVMNEMKEIFFSGTFGGEALSLAAAIATIDKMRREPVIKHLWSIGKTLAEGAEKRLMAHGLSDVLSLCGLAPWKIFAIRDHVGGSKEAIKTLFIREMLQSGVLINASHNVTASFGAPECQQVLAAYDQALAVVAKELDRGGLDARMGTDIIRPVFAVRAGP